MTVSPNQHLEAAAPISEMQLCVVPCCGPLLELVPGTKIGFNSVPIERILSRLMKVSIATVWK